MTTDDKKTVYDIVVFEKYTVNGVEKTKSWQVGTAFESKDGSAMNCELPAGIQVSGRFSIFPRREKTDAP